MAKPVWKDIGDKIKADWEQSIAQYHAQKCAHEILEYCRGKLSNGNLQLRKRCMECGELIGTAYKKGTVDNFDSLPIVDQRQNYAQEKNKVIKAIGSPADLKEAMQQAFWDLYQNHLSSQDWAKKGTGLFLCCCL